MRRYGFFQRAAARLPERRDDGQRPLRPHGVLPQGTPEDIGRVAIGQERLLATPMQMAEVVATIANGGVRMRPWMVRPGGLARRQDCARRTIPSRSSA